MAEQKTRCHMIGNAHLDPVWLWSWREGFQENTATLLSALERSDRHDEFIFMSTSAGAFYTYPSKNTGGEMGHLRRLVGPAGLQYTRRRVFCTPFPFGPRLFLRKVWCNGTYRLLRG